MDDRALLADAERLQPAMVELRRRLHRHPEIGLALPWTRSVVESELRALDLAPVAGDGLDSVVAVIEGSAPGPAILLRADMDALPLREQTGLPFSSEVDGAMHACGHDLHITMLLAAARLLVERRDRLAGRVVLCFQPGEEGYYGAQRMIEAGLLDGLDPARDRSFAIHVFSSYPAGSIHLRPGPLMAAMDVLRLTIHGRGGHASAQYLAVNPTPIAAEVILAMEAVTIRQVSPVEPAIVTFSNVVASSAPSVIPESARLTGTMRSFDEATRARLKAHVRTVIEGICTMHGAVPELEIEDGYPMTANDPTFAALVLEEAAALVGDRAHEMPAPVLAAEDFSYISERIPGAMAFLGTGPDVPPGTPVPNNHSAYVTFDEAPMAVGAALHAAVALRHLARG